MVRDSTFLAEHFDEFLCLTEVFSWHIWKQVVLDLAGELAEEEVGETVRQKVSGGNDLLVEVVHIFDEGHAFVVRGKG